MYLHKSPCRYKKKIPVVLKIRTHFLVFTCWEKRPAGAARAPETVQMLRMASRTDTRPDLGARGFTIACNIKNVVYCIQWGINNWELAGDTQLFSFQKMFSFLVKTWRSLQSQASCCLAICLILNCRQLLNGSQLQMKESRLVIEDQFVFLIFVKSELGNGYNSFRGSFQLLPFSCQC